VRFLRLDHGEGIELPRRASPGSAGLDLRAAVTIDVTVGPGERALVPTGFIVAIPAGWEGQVRPRSGLALREGLTLLNTPGTIDSDYRGELQVLVVNLGQLPVTIRRGDRVAQLVIAPVAALEVEEVSTLDDTERGEGGFGSTGKE
jgi:dUTP pyrophosphatase